MGGPLKISLICLVLLLAKVNSQNIIQENDNVTVEDVGNNRYVVSMNENNHEYVEGSPTLLFRIANAPTRPIISFSGASFLNIIDPDSSNEESFFLYANQPFDFETQGSTYPFNIYIGDVYIYVTFSILNIDDEPPSLTSPQCLFDENTIYTVQNSNCTCTVSDPDGFLSQMTFDIIPNPNAGGEENIFALEFGEIPIDNVTSAPVFVTVNQELNYQSVIFYLFDIQAEDGAHHPTIPNKLVRATINVNDLPDTPPEWITYFTFAEFEEQTDQTFSVTAIDGDHGLNYEIIYRKIWEDDEEADYISIDYNGTITVREIDRDKNDISMYNFEIMAYEVFEYPLWNNSLSITFYITDIDNNPPLVRWVTDDSKANVTFDETTDKVTSVEFFENYAGNLNLTIFIRDIDTGENAQFTVELEDLVESTEPYADAFLIVPTAGYRTGEFQISVRNAGYLDYEVPEWIHIKFNVLTKGLLDSNKQDRILVNITLKDYNDELPKFNETEYEISIKETAKKAEIITQIMATDRDAEDIILSHTLIGSTYTNRVLDIEEETGRILVKDDNAFDYDTVNPIFVQVRATDKVGHVATVPLTINLLDINNKAPTISAGGPITVDENQVSNIILNANITASDMDTNANLTAEINWENSYAMKNSRTLDMTNETIIQQSRFLDVAYHRVDENDETNRDIVIQLIVNDNNPSETTPDFELFDSLFISLVVKDWNTDPDFDYNNNTSAFILIGINDINDNTPYFPEADIPQSERPNRTVQENAPKGTSVGAITAIDLDVDDIVTYDCQPLDSDFDWVDVDETTGAFSVKDDALIDADSHKTFSFYYECTASDNDDTHTSEPLTVQFYVIDTNNQWPVISMPLDVYIDEKSPAGTKVRDIGTEDEDRDIPFHTVECRFSERSGSCFDSFTIDNNVLIVKYGGDDINRDAGDAIYACSMTCQDNPDRLQNDPNNHTSVTTFTIHLIDINDNKPIVLTKDLATSENTNMNDLIGVILATDIDEGDNAEIVFNISKVINVANEEILNLFDIETDDDYYVDLTHKQANLIALEDLKGKYGTYVITIGVTDKGNPPLSEIYDVTLDVEKFNFEAPRFIYPATDNQPIVLLTSQQQNSPLVLFRPEDSDYLRDFYVSDNSVSDICEKWDVQFSLEQSLPVEDTIFTIAKIDSCSGQLQVNSNYNLDSVIGVTYNLQLTASVKDGEPQEGEESYTTTRSILINFLDNNQKPVFSVREWTFKFLEEDDSLTQVLEYQATYEVEDVTLPIYYYLVTTSDTIAELFAVDRRTGTVSLKGKLDYETDESFEFQIVASNDTSPTSNNPNSYLNVICNVIDINDNVPQWTRELFFGALMAGYIRNTPILTVEATDADRIDEGKLTYFINGSITGSSGLSNVPSDAFIMSQTTGEVRLNFQVDSTMSGYFYFDITVWDVQDIYENGPHWNTTTVTIFIITTDNTVNFRFLNTVEEVQNKEQEMLQVVTAVLGYEAYRQNIDKDSQNGMDLDNQTFASLYFVNSSTVQAIEADTILRLVSNIDTYYRLVDELRNQTGLILLSFPSNASSQDNLEEVLRAWLVGVSVVLGALCLILLVTFILKTRELNNRITNLTMRKFGSQESGLNRLGISAPTTNKHAIEGSNPIFNISGNDVKKDRREFDEISMRSGDSDLIGIEDNPEFDYQHKKSDNDSSQYI